SGGRDLAGNLQSPDPTTDADKFDIDTKNPTVTIAVSDTLISDFDIPGSFTVTATFSEAMDTAYTPTVSFSPDVSTTLTLPSGAWSAGNTVYTVTYTLADAGVEVTGVDVSVSGGRDLAGNLQSPDPTTDADKFDIDTKNPTVTITDPANGQYLYNDQFPITIQGTASDMSGIQWVKVQIDGGTWNYATYDSSTGAWSFQWNGPVSDGSHVITAMAMDGSGNTATKSVSVVVLPRHAVTSSSLCPLPNNQFKLLFIQDMQNPSTYKLTASNPGQFYYNVFYIGKPGSAVTLTITIPAPFVTQGATPVHLYSSVSIGSCGCFVPSGEIASYKYTITGLSGGTIELTDIEIPSTGLVYVTVHLDFGYKITPGWTPDGGLNAYLNDVKKIPNNDQYEFSYAVGSLSYKATVSNVNEFKKIPGFGGIVADSDGNGISGVTITVTVNGKTYTTITNDDGFYLIAYKTGKEQSFTITATKNGYGSTQTGFIKANRFVVTNFSYP
ncbi:MAG: Ig-like domain-containing protein, partial [Candidatus Bathyarchaeia archaeon]